MVSGPPPPPHPLPSFQLGLPAAPGQGCSSEVPDGPVAPGPPRLEGSPEKIGLRVRAPHWIPCPGNEWRGGGSRETPPDCHPEVPYQIQTLPWASQATPGQCREGSPPRYSLSPPQILYIFCKIQEPAECEKRHPGAALNVGRRLPTFSGPLLTGDKFFRIGKSGLLLLLVGGAPGPIPRPHPGASRPWPHPLFSAGTQRKGGRVPAARPRLGRVPGGWTRAGHAASWRDWPAMETRGSRSGTRGRDGGHWAKEGQGRGPLGGDTPAKA